MKVGLLLGLSALAVTATNIIAGAGDPLSYPHLTQLNQSQTCETLSLADGASHLPASVYKTAKVHFVVNSSDKMGFDYKEQEFNHDNINRCKALGFSKTGACAAGQYAVRFCPYDNAYFSQCCDTSLYPHTSCPSPKEPADKCVDDTGTHYAECNCPSYYKPCTGNNMQGVGTGCNRDGETVYAACECKSGYKYVCEEFGPTSPNDYCLNGIKYYTSCKTCGEYGYLTSCPTGVECSFEQCSGKYFPTGKCTAGYTDISDTSCDWYKYWMPCSVAPGRA